MSSFSLWHWLIVAAIVYLVFVRPFQSRSLATKKKAVPDRPDVSDAHDFEVEVVGESHYQKTLLALCGGRTPDGVQEYFEADLVPEDANPHDPKAVRIDIKGQTVGYLSREDAREWRRTTKPTRCRAVVVGGWDRGSNDKGHFGVRLDAQF